MNTSASTPWYRVPTRLFPAKVWLERRYSFRVSIPPLVQQAAFPADLSRRRPFPALAWLEERRAGR